MNQPVKLVLVIVAAVALGIAVVTSSADPQHVRNDADRLNIVSSFYPLHEFVGRVGGDRVDAALLVPAGVEPHDWEPTVREVQQLQASDMIVINGAGFERWVDGLLDGRYDGMIADTSAGISVREEGSGSDPHIWLSPPNAMIQVQNIADMLSLLDPPNKAYYQSNAEKYVAELAELDSGIREGLSGCSSDFVSFHDAFSYFADEYGLTQHSIIQSTDPRIEATARTIQDVILLARDLGMDVVFSEDTANSRTSEIIADEIGGTVLVLSPLEINTGGTYVSVMNENLENLRKALC
ncbi:MAG: zinc ABC transporter substrate-binding protein [Nitrosopumilus sp. H13]|nr:MAG: zinc ABC transporter substrate-binding protein [Nitrosopumilus sp. H13]